MNYSDLIEMKLDGGAPTVGLPGPNITLGSGVEPLIGHGPQPYFPPSPAFPLPQARGPGADFHGPSFLLGMAAAAGGYFIIRKGKVS